MINLAMQVFKVWEVDQVLDFKTLTLATSSVIFSVMYSAGEAHRQDLQEDKTFNII